MEWEKISCEEDPDRCHGINSGNNNFSGQCHFKRIPPSNFCPRHGGNMALAGQKEAKKRNYYVKKWRERINEFADNPEIKSLREEVGIIRMMIETVLNKCNDENDLLIYSNQIQTLVQQAQKLVESCHKLEQSTGTLLDKQTILVVCDSLVKIISEHVLDSDVLDILSHKMVDVVAGIGGLNVTKDVGAITGQN